MQLPPTGWVVTARNVTPLGAASETTTLCAWFGPLFLTTSEYAMSAWPFTSCTCGVASFTICRSIDSFPPGGGGGGGGGGGVLPQPTWTLALSLSDPPFHVTTAVFVRPLFGDGLPFAQVHRSL